MMYRIVAVQKRFHFLSGPADVLNASTACRRWRELAFAGSVWQVTPSEGTLDKAEAIEVSLVPEAPCSRRRRPARSSTPALVFMLKVRGRQLA